MARERRHARFTMNNADLIIATLKANGVTRGFGIPSGNVLPLMEAMRQGGVEFVLTAHEGSAGFAADVTGRMTGAPGLCIATLGPGATNLATGVGGAFLDRSPVIAITCNLSTDQLGRRIQMWIDHHALFKPITKATLKLEPGCVAETVTRAIALALSEPKGPVHLDLPEDVALAATNEELVPPAQPEKLAAAPDAALARAAELIAAAKRPIAILGATAMRVADPVLLRNVIERHNLPFATTTMTKGMIDDDHPLSLGCIERACRQVQRMPTGGRLLSDDVRRGRDRQAARHHASGRRARRPLARADQGKADPPPGPARRNRTACGSRPRAAGALFRRAHARRHQCRRARGRGRGGAGGKRTDGDRGRGRFRALHRHGLRLTHSSMRRARRLVATVRSPEWTPAEATSTV